MAKMKFWEILNNLHYVTDMAYRNFILLHNIGIMTNI